MLHVDPSSPDPSGALRSKGTASSDAQREPVYEWVTREERGAGCGFSKERERDKGRLGWRQEGRWGAKGVLGFYSLGDRCMWDLGVL